MGAYTLPDPLAGVSSAADWRDKRRGEILALFEKQVYGRPLAKPRGLKFEVQTATALDGKATRKRVRVALDEPKGPIPLLTITMYVPQGTTGPAPAFVGMHLFDTSADHPVPGRPLEVAVGESLPGDRLMEVILARGYAVATLDAKDFCPDDKNQFRSGVLAHYFPERCGSTGARRARRDRDLGLGPQPGTRLL